MIIDCISDLHGFYPDLEGGDLLIVAGDLTARNTDIQHAEYCYWQYYLPYKKIIFIAGNHDGYIEKRSDLYIDSCDRTAKVAYLQDFGCEFEGLKIWGSPWTPTFYDWHFMKDRGSSIKEKWNLIPDDTDILITHGPPFGVLDQVDDKFCGCEELREAIFRIKPKLHVFGHIHSQGGKKMDLASTICVNASIMDEEYNPVNKPVRIIL